MNFYDSPTQGTDLASQADPLGATGGDNVVGGSFGAFEQQPAVAEIGGGAGGGTGGAAGGKQAAPAKKKMSTGKKVGIAFAGIVGLAAVAVILTPSPPTVPSGLPRSQPVTAAPAGMLGGAPAPEEGTLMGSAPPVPAASSAPVAAETAPAIVETPPAPAAAEEPVSQAVAATAPPAVAVPAPASAPRASTSQPVVPAAAAVVAATTKNAVVTTPAAVKPTPDVKLVVLQPANEAKSADPVGLAARVAVLERRLAKYEGRGAAQRLVRGKATAAREVPKDDRSATLGRALEYVGAAPAAPAALSQPIPRQASPVISSDTVRVLGISTRQGVATALVEFGGTKHRVAMGDRIPGLGPVRSVAFDAAGNPVIEINGARYE